MFRPQLRRQHNVIPACQRRTFLGLQRTPAPKPQMMGYLVLQGLAVVLLADLAIATAQNEPTTIRSVAQSAGLWLEAPAFEEIHESKTETAEE